MAFVPLGCGGIEHPPLKQWTPAEGPHAPNRTIERLRDCVEEYGGDLGGRGFEFKYTVKVDEEGRAVDITSDVFHADFGGCTRAALGAMQMDPEYLLSWMSEPLARRDGPTNAARSSVGNVVVIMGVVVTLAPIIIKTTEVTIILAIALTLTGEVVEAIRRRKTKKDECTERYEECIDSDVGATMGNTWNETRCGRCLSICVDPKNVKKSWPSHVLIWDEWLPCGRLAPDWRK